MQVTFSPRQELVSRLKYWWILLVFAILGALIGWGASKLIHPVYEADALLSLAVDFSKIGMPTDIEQDQIIELVGDICKSSLVVDQVLENYPELTRAQFNEMVSIERRNMQWVMKIRSTDNTLAMNLADDWQKTSYTEIMNAYQHAILVDAYANEINSVTKCIEHTVPQQPETAYCGGKTVEILQSELNALAEKMKTEQSLSYGISPAISISEQNSVELPTSPVYGLKSLFILAGGAIGMMIGFIVIALLPRNGRIEDSIR